MTHIKERDSDFILTRRAMRQAFGIKNEPQITIHAEVITVHGKHKDIRFSCELYPKAKYPHMILKGIYADGGAGSGKGRGREVIDSLETIARGLNLKGLAIWKGCPGYWDKQTDFKRYGYPETHVKDFV